MSWKLMLSLLVFAPIIAIVAWQFKKRIRPAFVATREQNAVLNTRTQENLAGHARGQGVRAASRTNPEQFERTTASCCPAI